MARILFEPIGEEIDCAEDETILDASFRQGYSLVHGCRAGQCSACKCYLLEGEVSLKTYSTFALSESESEQGYTLLCRAMPDDDDITVELLHFDPDNYKAEHEIQDGRAVVESVRDLTHDISEVVLRVLEPAGFAFAPGHFVDLHVPGSDERRSFSMANLPGDGRLELIVKRYPGGRISGLLDGGALAAGDELGFTGPYGTFRLRENDRPMLMIAGGSGMAPQLALLRQIADEGIERPVRFFYGARTRDDLFLLDELAALSVRISDLRFVPVLSEEEWDGEQGFVHDAVARYLDGGELGEDVEAYLCGPPPMVEAATEMLVDGRGIDAAQVHFDKFTTSVAVGDQEATT
ncbi:NADH:ubiquinone reductase (Na(+)-transporting) subunit F [Paraconexibacter algicola]|uniref:CDP-6-deoxy-delta-3,4-glucoseen reductase n=1 Tax=Paraconexibacter algicola TaxID=2133960 RepID=A0A2T4UK59_9ACTN|nr:2Fe-2S iron-sulfur cluster-binding protein [Paraconexibacter algicola]PTL59597.1 CDP-6-deoxy-delta-3,4-glucoseen reductase [Paraconexibacter algicola]